MPQDSLGRIVRRGRIHPMDTIGNGAPSSDDEVVEEGDYEVIDEEQEAPKA